MYARILLIGILAVFLLVPLSAGLSEGASNAKESLKGIKEAITETGEAGYSTVQMNDMLLSAENILEAQVALENQGGESDFSLVYDMIDRIDELISKAYETGDELSALRKYIDSVSETGLDMSEAEALYKEAEEELKNERYDIAAALIDNSYQKISEVQSESTTAYVIYRATTETFIGFVRTNWLPISISIIILISALILTKKRIRISRIKRKINKLHFERKILEDLIKKTQKEYFETKKIAEEVYDIRIKKFSEMIRDINRQIPLLNEQIVKVKK
jgi:DNA repair ATPase RecN